VLRVAACRASAYLWAQHLFMGRDAGLTDEEMARIAFGPEAPFFAPLETALLRSVDELIDDGAISAETWETLAAEFDAQQLLDVVFTVGCYNTIAWFFESFDLEVDPEIPGMLMRDDSS
jgi:alkylhydroperoxidase family enzyme